MKLEITIEVTPQEFVEMRNLLSGTPLGTAMENAASQPIPVESRTFITREDINKAAHFLGMSADDIVRYLAILNVSTFEEFLAHPDIEESKKDFVRNYLK